jgi:CheY-like chemotaxis protein
MLKPITLLIIDDDDDDKQFLIEVAREICCSINFVLASSFSEAMDILKDSNNSLPDFIFLDLNMPRINGKQGLEYLKNNPKLSSIPVIIYTTSKLPEDMEDTKNLGAAHFITKPHSSIQLKKEIEFVLKEIGKVANGL